MAKVCSKAANWIFILMLIVPATALSAEDPPPAQDQKVREPQPVAAIPVPPALRQALASSLGEAALFGAKAIPTPPTGSWGIVSEGDGGGGIFRDSDSEAEAWLGTGGYGVMGFGPNAGGYFADIDSSGFAWVGYGDWGISAAGNSAGGFFEDWNSSSWADVGAGTYRIYGSGTLSFVQNHPYDPSAVIVYAAPEGDEVATSTRGTARLVEGEATVQRGETFRWVTKPDLGLTTFLTPVKKWCDLYVAEQAADSIVVRSRDGSDCGFNSMVYGLRIGFEESSIVQEKQHESIRTDGWNLVIPASAPPSLRMTRARSTPRPSVHHPRTWQASWMCRNKYSLVTSWSSIQTAADRCAVARAPPTTVLWASWRLRQGSSIAKWMRPMAQCGPGTCR